MFPMGLNFTIVIGHLFLCASKKAKRCLMIKKVHKEIKRGRKMKGRLIEISKKNASGIIIIKMTITMAMTMTMTQMNLKEERMKYII